MPDPALQPLDEFDYHPRLSSQAGPALVLFSSPGCGTCRVVEGRLRTMALDLPLFKVDVQCSQALARAFDIFHLPTLLLYRDGAYHARLNCEITPASLQQASDQSLAAPAEEEP